MRCAESALTCMMLPPARAACMMLMRSASASSLISWIMTCSDTIESPVTEPSSEQIAAEDAVPAVLAAAAIRVNVLCSRVRLARLLACSRGKHGKSRSVIRQTAFGRLAPPPVPRGD